MNKVPFPSQLRLISIGLFFLFSVQNIFGQSEHEAIRTTINSLFEGMRMGDSTMVRKVFHENVVMQSTMTDRDGNARLATGSLHDFLTAIGTPHDKVYNEIIGNLDIRIDGVLASVWTPYRFYMGETFSHCGYNSFQLFKSDTGWKIINLVDTRNITSCTQDDFNGLEIALNKFIDDWHKAAATADEDIFFGSMTDDGIYLGTDETERWVTSDFKVWALPYFQRESAWAFNPRDRNLYFSEDGNTAWWEEKLETWMGVCGGSGVLVHTDNGWKIAHYHLAVTVPNNKMQSFIELMNQ